MARTNDESLKKLESHIGEPVTLALYIRSLREAEGLTQQQFAEKLGISVQHLSNVENGRKQVSVERADAWARMLGFPEEMFVLLALQDQFERVGLQGYSISVEKAS